MGDHANDAVDGAFQNTYGGHDWHDKEDPYPHRIQRRKEHDPECTGQLVSRVNSNTGQTFLGCSRFPKCKYSE